MSNPIEAHPGGKTPLAQWLAHTVEQQGIRVKFQLRGNHLHLLCEGSSCPDQAILQRLLPALKQTDLNTLIPADQPPLYQVIVYGRSIGAARPQWTAPIHLNQIDRHLEQLRQQSLSSETATPRRLGRTTAIVSTASDRLTSTSSDAALILSNRSLARRGDADGIARYLSETLSALGVAVQVTVKTIPYPQLVRRPLQVASTTLQRLWIICEASYSPEPSLVGEPIAQKLRDLELEGFRDAIALIQVWGEAKPDWVLRVDLTPTREMLQEWARWGDGAAIGRLLEQALGDRGIDFTSTTLKDSTLHLCCSAAAKQIVPDQQLVLEVAAPLLERLGPQGVHTAVLYGQVKGQKTPVWVKWLKLPASQHPALAESALTLAQRGDQEAIAFLLNRLLNPDLDKQLATGGIRLQILSRQDVLHIMTDAPICPPQRQVAPAVIRFLQQLRLPGVAGVRVYGRRAGQKRPLWSDGVDFVPRDRLVSEVTPEFAAADIYFGDLISRSDEIMLRPDLTSADLQTAWTGFRQRITQSIQQVLIRSQFFVASTDQDLSTQAASATSYQGMGMLMVWGMAGLLLMVQADWMMARMLHKMSLPAAETASIPSATAATNTPLSEMALRRSPSSNSATFDSVSSTQLPEADTVAKAIRSASPFPTFNSRQLDEKIALYYQRLAESGPPDVMIVGSSRALRGVDPAALRQVLAKLGYTNVSIFNFGVNGATAQVVDLILHRVLTPAQLPRLILWADGARAFNSGSVDTTYNGIVASQGYQHLTSGALPLPSAAVYGGSTTPFSASPTGGIGTSVTASYQTIDRWLDQRLATLSASYQERDRLKSLFQASVTNLLSHPLPLVSGASPPNAASSLSLQGQSRIDFDGFLPLSLRFNPATYYQQYARVSGVYDSDYESFQIEGSQAIALSSLLQLTRAHNIPVIFVNLPLTQEYLDPTRLQYEQEFKQYMTQISLSQQGLIFRDLGQLWLTQNDYFSDPSHLNRYGAAAMSHRLALDPMIPWVQAIASRH